MKEAEELFMKYTSSYKKYGPKIDLKISHTIRVENLCIEIANSLNLTKEEVDLAAYCGLLHDIGRFEQWKRYGTYEDRKSIDHGNLGVDLLKENNLIKKYTTKNNNTILLAVKYHNKYRVPNTLNDKNRLFVNITRDADKIDIMGLFVTGELVSKTENTLISNKVYNSLLNKELVKLRDMKTKADQIAVRLGFIFDMNFKKSYEILKERDYVNKMINNELTNITNKELIKQLEDLRKYCNKYIEEMIKC